jgi:hypothetical protein
VRFFAFFARGATGTAKGRGFRPSPAAACAGHKQPGIGGQPGSQRRCAHVRCPTATATQDATFAATVEATAAALVIDAYLPVAADLDVQRLSWRHREFARHLCGGATGFPG